MDPFFGLGGFLWEADDSIFDPTMLIAAAPMMPIGIPFKNVLRLNAFFFRDT